MPSVASAVLARSLGAVSIAPVVRHVFGRSLHPPPCHEPMVCCTLLSRSRSCGACVGVSVFVECLPVWAESEYDVCACVCMYVCVRVCEGEGLL